MVIRRWHHIAIVLKVHINVHLGTTLEAWEYVDIKQDARRFRIKYSILVDQIKLAYKEYEMNIVSEIFSNAKYHYCKVIMVMGKWRRP